MKSRLIVAVATMVTLVGGASLASAEESGEGCPNWGGLSGCTAENVQAFCVDYYATHYPGCTVTSWHCSSQGNYNCFTTQ